MVQFTLSVTIVNGLLLLSHFSSAQNTWSTFFHVANQRYLSSTGKSTTFSPYYTEKFTIYNAGNGKSFLLTSPWLEGGTPKKTLEITGGCNLNGRVGNYQFNRAKNQMWVLNGDGSISSACNPNWILVTDHYGTQTVQNINSVPAANRVWRQGSTSTKTYSGGDFSGGK